MPDNIMKYHRYVIISIIIYCLASAATAKEQIINRFCGKLKFGANAIADNITANTDVTEECNRWKKGKPGDTFTMHVGFPTGLQTPIEDIYVSREHFQRPGDVPDFVIYDKKKNKYIFGWPQFTDALNFAPIYQERLNEMWAQGEVAAKPTFISGGNENAGFVICQINYVDNAGVPQWRDEFYAFYKRGEISVRYRSPLLSLKKKSDTHLSENMTKLFKSMR